MLLEAHKLRTIDLREEREMITEALEAIFKFRDHNFPLTTPIVDFWKQKLNPNTGVYTQTSTNIAEPVRISTVKCQSIIRFVESLFI